MFYYNNKHPKLCLFLFDFSFRMFLYLFDTMRLILDVEKRRKESKDGAKFENKKTTTYESLFTSRQDN